MNLSHFGEMILRISSGRRGAKLLQTLIGDVGFPLPLVRCRTNHGISIKADPTSIMDIEIIRSGYYEPEVLEVILEHLPENGVFWDIGANIGLHSLTVNILRPSAKVLAFEPMPLTLSRLLEHVRVNSANVTVLPIALGAQTGYSEMKIRLRGNSGISSLNPWPKAMYDASTSVRVERGDSLIAADIAPAPNIIKVDVEGFEKQVLMGLENTLDSGNLRAVLFESEPDKLQKLKGILSGKSFEILPIRSNQIAETSNFIAIRLE